MKVSDVMSRQVDYVTPRTSVKDVCRIIFGRGINGVPVCQNRKVIGFITERDVLAAFFPTMQEYVEDPVHSSDFEGMEKNVASVFSLKAEKIMSNYSPTIRYDAPLMKAQSLMIAKKVGRLPVVNEKDQIVGMVSKGDIFRAVVGDQLPFEAEESYHDWLSKHYDLVVDWGERLGNEEPDLLKLFKKHDVKNVADILCGTGEHDIALAKQGFHVVGINKSTLMNKAAQEKLYKLPKKTSKNLEFMHGIYTELLEKYKSNFDAAIFMGNALCHIEDYKNVLKTVSSALKPKNSILVLQIINYEKVFKVNQRFLDLNFNESKLGIEHEHAFLEFYDPPRRKGGSFTLNMAIFDFDGKKWKYRSMDSTPIAGLDKIEIETHLRSLEFKKISFYGSNFLGSLFKEPFKPLESDWLNIIAER